MKNEILEIAIEMLENAGFTVARKLREDGIQLTISLKASTDFETETPFYYPEREIDTFSIIE